MPTDDESGEKPKRNKRQAKKAPRKKTGPKPKSQTQSNRRRGAEPLHELRNPTENLTGDPYEALRKQREREAIDDLEVDALRMLTPAERRRVERMPEADIEGRDPAALGPLNPAAAEAEATTRKVAPLDADEPAHDLAASSGVRKRTKQLRPSFKKGERKGGPTDPRKRRPVFNHRALVTRFQQAATVPAREVGWAIKALRAIGYPDMTIAHMDLADAVVACALRHAADGRKQAAVVEVFKLLAKPIYDAPPSPHKDEVEDDSTHEARVRREAVDFYREIVMHPDSTVAEKIKAQERIDKLTGLDVSDAGEDDSSPEAKARKVREFLERMDEADGIADAEFEVRE